MLKKTSEKKLSKMEKKILKKMGLKRSFKTLDKLDGKNLYKYNSYRQKIKGKKKYDYFEITEIGHSDENIFKYKNLIEWDIKNFNFQEKSRENGVKEQRKWQKKRGEKLSPKYKAKEYTKLYMPGDWFRALELSEFGKNKRKLVYGHLESAHSYIYTEVLEKLEEAIEKEYPYIYVRPYGVSMFEDIPNSKYSRMTDTEKRAAGKEKELEFAQKRLVSLWDSIDVDIEKHIKKYSGYTFRKYSDKPVHDHLDFFIIGGFEAANDISFKSFFKDFYKRIQPVEVLDKIIDILIKKYIKIILKSDNQVQSDKLKKLMEDKSE